LIRKLVVLVTAALAMVVASPAQAITYGYADGELHPQTGAMAQDTRGDGVLRQICSGSLISSTVYLTAAHCTSYLESEGFTTAFVTFDTSFDPKRSKFYEGTMYTNPDYYSGTSYDSHDIAVIVFDKPIRGITPAQLPEAGLFDEMKRQGTLDQSTEFTPVGYGLSEAVYGGGSPTWKDYPYRQYTHGSFNALNDTWLRLSQNNATDDGGTCYGDSGGPNFLGGLDSTLVAGITITGDYMCQATNDIYRLDTASARGFLDDFVALP